jgi:hypothetical protein
VPVHPAVDAGATDAVGADRDWRGGGAAIIRSKVDRPIERLPTLKQHAIPAAESLLVHAFDRPPRMIQRPGVAVIARGAHEIERKQPARLQRLK